MESGFPIVPFAPLAIVFFPIYWLLSVLLFYDLTTSIPLNALYGGLVTVTDVCPLKKLKVGGLHQFIAGV